MATEKEDHITAATDDDTVESLKGLTIEPEPTSKSSSTVVTVKLNDGADEKSIKLDGRTINFSAKKVVGNGSFGVVFQALVVETGETVAIKKVLQDKRFKNRELQIMRIVDHPNIVALKHCFYSNGDKRNELYLNLVLEYVPETVYRITRTFQKKKKMIPILCVKLQIYQLCRSLAYIHAMGICHRDIKPQNLLVNPETWVLKLCDFGSAKKLLRGEPNVSYICSRYYRAPELIFGATDYTTAIDVWSLGCVFAELLLGQPLFPGESGVDQLVEIIKVLGTPTRDQITAMNRSYTEFKFPLIRPHPWRKIFRDRTPDSAIDVLIKMLEYEPLKRIDPLSALAHPFFDELRLPTTTLPSGKALPELFNFTPLEMILNPKLIETLIPAHAQNETNWPVEKVLKEAIKAGTVAKPYKLHHPYTETNLPAATTSTSTSTSTSTTTSTTTTKPTSSAKAGTSSDA